MINSKNNRKGLPLAVFIKNDFYFMTTNLNTPQVFIETLKSLQDDFDWAAQNTNDYLADAYFDLLARKHRLRVKSVKLLWEAYLMRRSSGQSLLTVNESTAIA